MMGFHMRMDKKHYEKGENVVDQHIFPSTMFSCLLPHGLNAQDCTLNDYVFIDRTFDIFHWVQVNSILFWFQSLIKQAVQ